MVAKGPRTTSKTVKTRTKVVVAARNAGERLSKGVLACGGCCGTWSRARFETYDSFSPPGV